MSSSGRREHRDPGARNEIGGAGLGGRAPLHRGDEVAHRPRLVRHLAGHQRALGRVDDGLQDVVPPLGPDHRAVGILLVLGDRAGGVADRDPDRLRSALGHHDQPTPASLSASACATISGSVSCASPSVKTHQHAVGRVGRGAEQLRALREHGAQIGAALAREVGIERVEVHPDGAAVHGERREDVALPGEGDEAEPVALEILDQTPRLSDRRAAAGWARRPPPASSG